MAIAGCAKSSATVLKDYPAYPEDHPIEVISDFPSDRSYEEIALIDAKGGWDRSKADAVAIRYSDNSEQ